MAKFGAYLIPNACVLKVFCLLLLIPTIRAKIEEKKEEKLSQRFLVQDVRLDREGDRGLSTRKLLRTFMLWGIWQTKGMNQGVFIFFCI
jgi:hypothetical protein